MGQTPEHPRTSNDQPFAWHKLDERLLEIERRHQHEAAELRRRIEALESLLLLRT